MSKFFVLFAIGCLINVYFAARLPRSADTNDSSSNLGERTKSTVFAFVTKNVAREKNITLTDDQKSKLDEVLDKNWVKTGNETEDLTLTLKDVEQLRAVLTNVIPSAVVQDVSSLFSKFAVDATSARTDEDINRMHAVLFGES